MIFISEGKNIIVPRTRAYVPLKELDIKYIIGKSSFTYEQVIEFIQNIMNETIELTIKECEEWIDQYVPKRTGQLRDTLKEFLAKSRLPPTLFKELRNVRLILGAGAKVKYAEQVREMSEKSVQHFGTWLEHSGKKAYAYYYEHSGPIYLDDPKAVSHYFDKLVAYGIERLKINLSKIKWVNMNAG